MSEQVYNFEPDYAKWWAKPDLGKDELIWLMLGVSPDDAKRENELNQKEQLSHEEIIWKHHFFDYYDNIDAFIGKTVKQHKELLEWKGCKKQFLQDAYEFRMPLNETLIDYLIDTGEFKKNPKLEAYKETEQRWTGLPVQN